MAQDLSIQIQYFLFNEHFLLQSFLKYFVRKNLRSGDKLLLKNGTLDGYATNHVVPGRIYIVRCPWYFGDFCNIFLPNTGVKTKKSLTM